MTDEDEGEVKGFIEGRGARGGAARNRIDPIGQGVDESRQQDQGWGADSVVSQSLRQRDRTAGRVVVAGGVEADD